MQLNFDSNCTKNRVLDAVENHLRQQNLDIAGKDETRPWGGFFVIPETQTQSFVKIFFPHLEEDIQMTGAKLSPKILVVAPGKRLSWQYHHRRAEIWKLIGGEARIMTSDNDEESMIEVLHKGDVVQLAKGTRHRLIGSESQWGIVAEIWQHTDPDNPSDEEDIIRLQDDFGRKDQ